MGRAEGRPLRYVRCKLFGGTVSVLQLSIRIRGVAAVFELGEIRKD